MRHYPLRYIQEALADTDRTLLEAILLLRLLVDETQGTYPPGGAEALAGLLGIRKALSLALPPALLDAIIAEQLLYDIDHEKEER